MQDIRFLIRARGQAGHRGLRHRQLVPRHARACRRGWACRFSGVVDPAAAGGLRRHRHTGASASSAPPRPIRSGAYGRAMPRDHRRTRAGLRQRPARFSCRWWKTALSSADNPRSPRWSREITSGPCCDDAGMDTLILGCTHYPLHAPDHHRQVDRRRRSPSSTPAGRSRAGAQGYLGRAGAARRAGRSGGTDYRTTPPTGFSEVAGAVFGRRRPRAADVDAA